MRLIDADELENKVADLYTEGEEATEADKVVNNVIDLIDNAPTIDDLSEYSDKLWKQAYERGKAERPQGEWIPVSERLPDLFEVVLVTDKTGKVFEYERRPLDEEGNVCEEWAFLGRNIIAWMPLPEPYKEAENE